jgi:hypothetical protein
MLLISALAAAREGALTRACSTRCSSSNSKAAVSVVLYSSAFILGVAIVTKAPQKDDLEGEAIDMGW